MTDDECREAYDHIDGMGFALVHEIWMTKPTADKDAEPVEWYEILAAAPYLSLNDLDQIEDWKRLRADKPAAKEAGQGEGQSVESCEGAGSER